MRAERGLGVGSGWAGEWGGRVVNRGACKAIHEEGETAVFSPVRYSTHFQFSCVLLDHVKAIYNGVPCCWSCRAAVLAKMCTLMCLHVLFSSSTIDLKNTLVCSA